MEDVRTIFSSPTSFKIFNHECKDSTARSLETRILKFSCIVFVFDEKGHWIQNESIVFKVRKIIFRMLVTLLHHSWRRLYYGWECLQMYNISHSMTCRSKKKSFSLHSNCSRPIFKMIKIQSILWSFWYRIDILCDLIMMICSSWESPFCGSIERKIERRNERASLKRWQENDAPEDEVILCRKHVWLDIKCHEGNHGED